MNVTAALIEEEAIAADTLHNKVADNIVAGVVSRVVYMLTRVFVPPFILAHITLESYGLWSTAFLLVGYLGVTSMGLSNAYIRYVAHFQARKEYDRINRLISTGLAVTLPLCFALFGLAWIMWPKIAVWINVPPHLMSDGRFTVLTVAAIFLSSLSLFAFVDLLNGLQFISTVQGIWTVTYLVETALIFLLIGTGSGLRGLAEAYLVRNFLGIGLCMIVAYRRLPWLSLRLSYFDRESLRDLVSYGGIVQFSGLLSMLVTTAERVVGLGLVGMEAVGLMDLAKKWPAAIASIPSAFFSSFLPAASQVNAEGREGEQNPRLAQFYLQGSRHTNLVCSYFFGLMAAVPAPIMVVWMGKDLTSGPLLLLIFTVSTHIHLLTGPGTSILKGIGRPLEDFHYLVPNLVALAVFLPASWLVERAWTVVGISLAVGLATLVSAAYFNLRANRLLGLSLSSYWSKILLPGVYPYAIAILMAWPVTHLTAHVGRWMGMAVLGIAGLLYTLLTAGAFYQFVLDSTEKQAAQRLLRRYFLALRRGPKAAVEVL